MYHLCMLLNKILIPTFSPLYIVLFFRLRALNATGNFSPPRPRIRLISSRPSFTFNGLALHEAGWPWLDSMSRSKAYRRVSCFWSACWQFSTWKCKFRRIQQREQIFLAKQTFFSRVPHSGGTSVSSAVSFFLIVWKDNFGTSRFHCHRY